MAALVGVIAHRCWDQIIGNLGAPAGMSRQLSRRRHLNPAESAGRA